MAIPGGIEDTEATRRGSFLADGETEKPESLGAGAAGVLVDERGLIGVDRQRRTDVPRIFAIGEVVGEPTLAHEATGLTIHPRRTRSQTVGFAAEAAERTITDLYRPERPSRAAAPVS